MFGWSLVYQERLFSPSEMSHALNNGLYFGKIIIIFEILCLLFAKAGASQWKPFTDFLVL